MLSQKEDKLKPYPSILCSSFLNKIQLSLFSQSDYAKVSPKNKLHSDTRGRTTHMFKFDGGSFVVLTQPVLQWFIPQSARWKHIHQDTSRWSQRGNLTIADQVYSSVALPWELPTCNAKPALYTDRRERSKKKGQTTLDWWVAGSISKGIYS